MTSKDEITLDERETDTTLEQDKRLQDLLNEHPGLSIDILGNRLKLLETLPLKCLTLSRLKGGCIEWLITNGINMGRWTRIFGVNCIADNFDCKQFVHNQHCEFPNSTISQVQVLYDSEPT